MSFAGNSTCEHNKKFDIFWKLRAVGVDATVVDDTLNQITR
jgi:hypothetical protein